MRDWRIAIEIDLRKVMIVGLMAASTALACVTGMGDVLMFIVPAGMACLFGKE